jgi:hypothetical protein
MDVTCWEVLEDWQILSANTKRKSTFDRGRNSRLYVKKECFRYEKAMQQEGMPGVLLGSLCVCVCVCVCVRACVRARVYIHNVNEQFK